MRDLSRLSQPHSPRERGIRGQGGFTFVELLVSLTLSSVLVGCVLTFLT